jgi:DNA-binding transcriptional LysR family regulator
MDVNLRQIRGFVAIAELGSFTKAAQAHNLAQPSLTVQIRQLEAGLGARLLDRNTRAAQLTAVGREMLPGFRRVLQEVDAVVSNTRALVTRQRGVVRLACLPSYAASVLPDAIARFQAAHPLVRFIIKDTVGKRIATLVKDESVDLAITAGAIADPELDTLALMDDRMHAVFPRAHALARVRRLTPEVLARHPLILMDEESTVRQVVNAGFAAHGLRVAAAYEATYMATAIGLVQAGLGVALLPSSAAEAQATARVASRAIASAAFTRKIWALRRRGRALPPAAEIFLGYLPRAKAPRARA